MFTRRQLSLTVSLRSRQAVKKVVKKVVKKPEVPVTKASREAEDQMREFLRKPGWSADIKPTLDTHLDEAQREAYKRWIASLPRQLARPNGAKKPIDGVPNLVHAVDPESVRSAWTPYQ